MSVKNSAVRDPRIVDYLPVKRIVSSSSVENPDFLIGKIVTQPSEGFSGDEVLDLKAGASLLVDFGMELNGGVRIVTGRKEGKIRIVFGESVSEAMSTPAQWHTLHDVTLPIPAMGATEFGNTGFRFVRLDIVEDVLLAGITAAYRHQDLQPVGVLKCSDERLQKIWDVCVHTVSLNMQDYILDGIKRDRLVWMGDLHPEVSVINLVYGKNPTVNASLDYIRDRTPLPNFMNGISSYSLWWVICQYDLYMHFADLDYLKEQHAYLKELMTLMATFVAANGKEILPETRFIDWPTKKDDAAIHVGLQALMTQAFTNAAKLAEYLADEELKTLCLNTAELLRAYTPPPTERKAPNALFALAGRADFDTVNREILSVDPCADLGTFMGFYTLSARAKAKDGDGVIDTIKKFYGAMLDFGATSFWEDFNMDWLENATPIDEPPVPGKRDLHADCGAFCYVGLRHSLCHGWASGPAAVLIQMLCGLEILEPGFTKIRLRPNCFGMESFSCTIPTPKGVIKIDAVKGQVPHIDLPRGISLSL